MAQSATSTTDFISGVLGEWPRLPQLAAVAHVLRATLMLVDARDCTTEFVEHERLPRALVDPVDPRGSPMTVPEALRVAAQRAEAGDAAAANLVRALFILLVQFDTRVRRLVCVDHGAQCVARWGGCRPVPPLRLAAFLDAPKHAGARSLRDACVHYIQQAQMLASAPSALFDSATAALVEETKARWFLGLSYAPPPASQKHKRTINE